ncbi:MAG: hypothetical protein U9Q35_04965 [Pseudomonadota bacterium]|uniref:hypothetical protein n=1 Tax=Halomonas sp. IOP_31 TaxID=2876584 RepID=UPI001E3A0E01|nr:hypothetical protein [Halomonas sp. IOP_31]MCD6009786.1 hypothetical protein [Halomonas sp. IOP_31]MEA3250915.1 hypothetical protein [Pseudomonadota bacterium]
MHKHVDWDNPGSGSVASHYAKDPNEYGEPHPGSIVTARYKGASVRIRVEAYRDATSIGDVVALIDAASGERMNALGELSLGDTVRLPDDKRAFQTAAVDDD